MGTQKIMDFAHNNPAVQVVSSRIGHNSSILSKLDKFVSINSAIEIDLSGQVNSETVDSRQISGIGGSIDYAETAFQSKYLYVDWAFGEFINNNPKFLQLMSIYNIASPILSLCLPIFVLIVPFFIIKIKGIQLNMDEYIDVFKKLISIFVF